jgi:uncharacterized phage-associated protein
MINFNFNKQKSIESVLWIIQMGESNMYNILKILFEAEKYHLNNHGRPITGDKYFAMKFGIVCSAIYDIIGENLAQDDFHKDENSLLTRKRDPNTDYLSESDIEALEIGFRKYAGLDFDTVENKNHEEPAWKKYYKQGTSTHIPFDELIDNDKQWLKEELQCISSNMVI